MTAEIDLEGLVASVEELLQQAGSELVEHQQSQQRQKEIEQLSDRLRHRIEGLVEQISSTLNDYQAIALSTANSEQLQAYLQRLQEMAESVEQMAALQVDERLWQEQSALLLRQQSAETCAHREQLRQEVLEWIEEAPDFWEATDLALSIQPLAGDLAEIDALTPIVERLIERINELDQVERDRPVAFLRGTHRATLNFIAEQALKNRSKSVVSSTAAKPRRQPAATPPNRYTDLKGKVIIFGGHDRLMAPLKGHLPNVEIISATAQGGNGQIRKAEAQVGSADVVLILTNYIAHSVSDRAKQACENCKIAPVLISTTGLTRCLEEIEKALLSRSLVEKFQK